MSALKPIRGHHLFCMALFSGHGYDKAFTENMKELITTLRSGTSFCIYCGEHDAICAVCPNKIPSGCTLGTCDVLDRDSSALDVLSLNVGEELNWTKAMELLAGVDEPGFEQVCGGCRWAKEGLCSWELLHERALFTMI